EIHAEILLMLINLILQKYIKYLFCIFARLKKHSFTTIMRDIGLLLLRIGMSGAMIWGHGYGKFMKVISGDMAFMDLVGIGATPTLIFATLAEFIAPILVIFGFKTRIATILLILTMFVAGFVVHASDPFASKEMSLLYLVGFASIALIGPGRYSIDRN